jgi:hypothetical protein
MLPIALGLFSPQIAEEVTSIDLENPHYIKNLSYVESSDGLEEPGLEGGRTEIELGDVNGDGNVDIVSIGDHGSPWVNTDEHGIMVWFGNGGGSWSVYQNGHFGYGGIALGDANDDGLMDVGYGMHHNYSGIDFGDQLLEVALGDGTGMSWTPWDDGLATNGETWGMFCTDFADVDNDGDLDLGANSFGGSAGVHIYLNQGDGTWVQSWGFVGGNSDMDFKFGDINGDGNVDFAVAHGNGKVYLGDGHGDFTLTDSNLPSGIFIPDLGDINNDGAQELAMETASGGVQVWTLKPTGDWLDISGTLPSTGPYEAVQIADMDVDGFRDLVAFGEAILTIWKGNGMGNWSKIVEFDIGADPGEFTSFRAGVDADHNGYPDIAIVEEEGGIFNSRNHLIFYKERTPRRNLWIKGIYPTGNEKFKIGSVQFIDWVSAVPKTEVGMVDLELTVDGEGGPWTSLASGIPNNGRYQWTVDSPYPSDDCLIRYTVKTASDTTSWTTSTPFELIE